MRQEIFRICIGTLSYRLVADDGWEGDAHESELQDAERTALN
jgi:hypothetical protein